MEEEKKTVVKKQIKFLTVYNCQERNKDIVSNPGQDDYYSYKWSREDDGHRIVVIDKTSKKSMVAFIQSFKDDVDLETLFRRFEQGDLKAIDSNKGWYEENFYALPKTFAEFLNNYDEAENSFSSLPLEFKKMFGNDFNRYAKSVADGTIGSKFRDFDAYLDNQVKMKKERKSAVDSAVKEAKENMTHVDGKTSVENIVKGDDKNA